MTDDDAGRPPGGPRDPAPPGVSPIRLWLPPAVYCILIFIQSAGPAPDGLPKFCYSDKLIHFLGYAVLGFLFCRAFSGAWPDRAAGSAIFAGAVATFVYGVTDEWHQAFVAERSASVTIRKRFFFRSMYDETTGKPYSQATSFVFQSRSSTSP